jgi:hypothetical protein
VEDDEQPRKKITGKRVTRLAIALAIAIAATSAWVYVRYLAPKAPLGGPCKWAMNCTKDAPRCMRESEDGPGVCSRTCEADAGDCAADVRCVVIELDDERDERGVPLKNGYCFPQAFLDAKKATKRKAEAPVESWIDVPEGRLEGELTLKRGTTYQIKGALLRPASSGKTRTIIDTAAMRAYAVDDEKKTFRATAIDATPGDASITKTGKKDKVEGRECEIWQIDRKEACVLQGASFVDPDVRAVPVWMRELAVRGALPLRVLEADGTERLSARFDARPIDGNLFVIPKSYKNLAR